MEQLSAFQMKRSAEKRAPPPPIRLSVQQSEHAGVIVVEFVLPPSGSEAEVIRNLLAADGVSLKAALANHAWVDEQGSKRTLGVVTGIGEFFFHLDHETGITRVQYMTLNMHLREAERIAGAYEVAHRSVKAVSTDSALLGEAGEHST
eukprot:6177872-Pleurochrysis_carterae.AAC.1